MRGIIFHNFGLKILSVGLATVIWLAIHHGIQNDVPVIQPLISRFSQQQYLKVPISMVRQPGDTRGFEVTPNEVIVTAAGMDEDLRRVAAADLRVFVDLTDYPTGVTASRPLHAETPPGLTVLKIEPAVVTVEPK